MIRTGRYRSYTLDPRAPITRELCPRVPAFGVPLNNGALRSNAKTVIEPAPAEGVVRGRRDLAPEKQEPPDMAASG
jgi:hypothetical protein